MPSPECVPLTMEPRSNIYKDPVILLDFQSLYPSIAIAYNYCFSTCLGKVQNFKKSFHNGTAQSNPGEWRIPLGALANYFACSPSRLKELYDADQLTFAPNGALFVKQATRKGLIPLLLTELLDTRVMVKTAMKKHKGNQVCITYFTHSLIAFSMDCNYLSFLFICQLFNP